MKAQKISCKLSNFTPDEQLTLLCWVFRAIRSPKFVAVGTLPGFLSQQALDVATLMVANQDYTYSGIKVDASVVCDATGSEFTCTLTPVYMGQLSYISLVVTLPYDASFGGVV